MLQKTFVITYSLNSKEYWDSNKRTEVVIVAQDVPLHQVLDTLNSKFKADVVIHYIYCEK